MSIESISRKRLIIEGEYEGSVPDKEMAIKYIKDLSDLTGMTIVHGPFAGNWAHKAFADRFSHKEWEAYAIWAESGIHVYAWETQGKLMTFEIFTCKDFDIKKAIDFTRDFFTLKSIAFTEVPAPLK